jgi:hypothetical protein
MRALGVRLLIVAAAGFLLPAQASAQSANDLVAKNLAARGGAEKLAAIHSLRLNGKLTFGGTFELTYTEVRARKNAAVRYDSSIQGLTLVQAYDGRVGWRVNPFEGRRDAERMSADQTGALADDGTIDGVLLTAKEKGYQVTYVGREDFDGTDAYKLRVSLPNGAEYMYYLDPDTYLEIKVVQTRLLRGARQVTVTELGDYELVNGVYFPFSIETGGLDSDPSQRQKITIDNAQANVAVSAAIFAMPAAPGSK